MDRPLRILRVITRLNVGGPSRHVRQLLEGLPPGRFEQVLVVGALEPGEREDFAPAGCEVVRIPELGRPTRPLRDLSALRALTRVARRIAPDIVHTHQAKAGALGRLAGVRAGVPHLVHTYHGHTFQGYWGPLFGRFVRAVEARLARRSDALVVQSRSQGGDLLRALGEGLRQRLVLIPPGIDFERLDAAAGAGRRPPRAAGGPVELLCVARLAAVKNLEAFLDLVVALRAEGPVRGRVCGDGPASTRAALDRGARERGLGPESFEILGWRDDVGALIDASDVVVLTSRAEGTPLSLIEAAGRGAAVAAFDVGGIRDVVGDLSGCRLADFGDVAALAAAVRELAGHPLGEEERRAQAEVVRRRFARERLLRDVALLYEALVGEGIGSLSLPRIEGSGR